jgi:hypothetical protein
MFSFNTINWVIGFQRGRPLTKNYTVVNLISATTTRGVLTIQAAYDARAYPKGAKIADTQLDTISITKRAWHCGWK